MSLARASLLVLLAAGIGASGVRPGPVAPIAPVPTARVTEPRCVGELPGVPVALCVTEDTPVETVRRISEVLVRQAQQQSGGHFELNQRWEIGGSASQGDPVTLRWSLPPDGVVIPDDLGLGIGPAPNGLQATLIARFGSVAAGKALIRQVLDQWSTVAGVRWVEVPDDGAPWGAPGSATRGDVRFAGRSLGAEGGGILAYNQYPPGGDMVLNTRTQEVERWVDYYGNRYFRNIVAHELGHGIGLMHVCPAMHTKLMEPSINLTFDGPQHDDIRGAQRFYGDRYEPNDTMATASPAIAPIEATAIDDVSIDDVTDVDWYRFDGIAGTRLSVRIFPVGFESYLTGPLTAACNTGNPVNSIAVQDLVLQVWDGSRPDAPVITRNAAPAGQGETVVGLPLTTTGPWFIRVSSGAMVQAIQTYGLTVDIGTTRPADLDGNGHVDGADLGILLGGWGGAGAGDLDGDGSVSGSDLGILLGDWG